MQKLDTDLFLRSAIKMDGLPKEDMQNSIVFSLLPPAYVVQWKGIVFTGVCLSMRGLYPLVLSRSRLCPVWRRGTSLSRSRLGVPIDKTGGNPRAGPGTGQGVTMRETHFKI